MTFKTRMSVLVLSTPVLAFVLVGGLMGAGNNAQSSGQQTYQHLRMFDDVVDLVMNNYVGDVPGRQSHGWRDAGPRRWARP